MISTIIKGRLMKGVAVAAVLAMISMAGALWWQDRALDRAGSRIENLSARLERAVEANKTNVGVINDLQEANAALLERIRIDVAKAVEAAQRARERAGELERQRDAARQGLREALSSTPSCEALASLDVAAACPALGDRLRDLQRRAGQD